MNNYKDSKLEDLKKYALQRYDKYREEIGRSALFKFHLISKLIGNNKIVLDLGCGDGFLSRMIKTKNNKVVGLDLIHDKLKAIQSNDIKCVTANLQGFYLPFRDNCFDVVVASEIIEHIWDCNFFLHEIKRVLKPKGGYIITTPNLASLGRRLMLLFGRNPFVENFLYPQDSGHLKHFVKKDFEYLLKKNGFIIKKIFSDVVIFSNNGKLFSRQLAKIFPNLGRSIIAVGRIE